MNKLGWVMVLVLVLVFGIAPPVSVLAADSAAVSAVVHSDRIDVLIAGKPFTSYSTSRDLPKPFFHPVIADDGHVLSRPLENPKDHPHHKGVWLAIDEVNDLKHWAEKAQIINVEAKVEPADGSLRLRLVNHWLNEDRSPVLLENTVVTIFPNRLMAYDIRFTPANGTVTFGDTKEGLFGFRLADTMREKEGGAVVNAAGEQGTKACWGKPAQWVDYVGAVDGHVHGVAIMDHPGNFRPSRYHVRDYGLFSVSPFGEKSYTGTGEEAPVKLPQGESLRLRYAIYFHAGDTKSAGVAQVYEQFVGLP